MKKDCVWGNWTFAFGMCQIYFFFFFFGGGGWGVTARQDYFTYFEPSQSLGGAKTGNPRENPSDHPQAELGLSHMVFQYIKGDHFTLSSIQITSHIGGKKKEIGYKLWSNDLDR